MRLLIKQRVFSWTDTYDIYDEQQNPKYYVRAKFFSIGHVIYIHNMRGDELGCIRQRVLTLLPKFDLEINGVTVGQVKKSLTLFSPRYSVDCKGWTVQGDFLGMEYEIYNGASNYNKVMSISKKWFSWGDTYVLDITDPRDELLGLMVAISIDAAVCGQGR